VSQLKQPLPQESQTLEYKRALPLLDSLVRTIAAFANTEGGEIIIGVDDASTILGLDSIDLEKAPSVVNAAQQLLRPHPLLNYHVEEINGKSLFIIEVQKYPLPVRTEKDRFYIRNANRTLLAEEAALHALANAVPAAKQNILSSLGVSTQDTGNIEKPNQFDEIVHKRIEEEPSLKPNESLVETIKLTRQELFSERREKRQQGRITFFVALIALVLALSLIFVGVVLIYTGILQAGIVTSASSIVSGIVSGLAFVFYRQANDRLDETAKELVTLERTHTAMEYIVLYIKDEKTRDEAVRDFVRSLVPEK
jgi:Putative DNA-binding domain